MVKSVIWSSMIDYPNNICTTLFLDGCNFNCEFCYNKKLNLKNNISFENEILPKLIQRRDFINHVILSGGECTISPYFNKIVNKLYKNGFKIGIHTNGYTPEILQNVIWQLDFIGMDIKNDFENYNLITDVKVDVERIKQSINLILKSNVNYEFRTTVYPKYIGFKNLEKIAEYLASVGCKEYTLQNYYDYNHKVKPYSEEQLRKMQEVCSKYLPTRVKGLL